MNINESYSPEIFLGLSNDDIQTNINEIRERQKLLTDKKEHLTFWGSILFIAFVIGTLYSMFITQIYSWTMIFLILSISSLILQQIKFIRIDVAISQNNQIATLYNVAGIAKHIIDVNHDK